ncbi:hypothetical protein B0H63DRAFT_557012 [Podospora didyma]|uniref:Uncharacterized protein n=1 Tax=Podospora didyma TaxID=330526 RepID=A0AAE0U461_9PEZI|nr:hypothetical protein B0H63DRAFT_557012 [Podospora didyma]
MLFWKSQPARSLDRWPLTLSSIDLELAGPQHSPRSSHRGTITNRDLTSPTKGSFTSPCIQAVETGQNAPKRRPPVIRLWMGEIILLVIAVGLIAAILSVLAKENGRPVEGWRFPLTLNSLTALLSTILRAVMVSVAAEIISQAKWTWFTSQEGRPLRDLQDFDSGSRHISGALWLLPTVALRSPPTLLAVIVIVVSFAIGPFVQQAIQTAGREVASDVRASLPVSHFVKGDDLHYRRLPAESALFNMQDLVPRARGDMINAFAGFNMKASTVEAFCATGNCLFPSSETLGEAVLEGREATHSSAGICSSCIDITSLTKTIRKNDTEWKTTHKTSQEIVLPNGLRIMADAPDVTTREAWLNVSANDCNIAWAQDLLPPEKELEFRWPFAIVTVLTATVGKNKASSKVPSEHVAVSCSLYPCLRTYWATVHNGAFTEKPLNSTPMLPDFGAEIWRNAPALRMTAAPISNAAREFANLTAIQSPCRVNDTIYTSANMSTVANGITIRIVNSPGDIIAETRPRIAPEECVVRFDSTMAGIYSAYFQKELFSGSCTWDSGQGSTIDCGSTWWLSQLWEQKNATVQSISDRFSTFATAATNSFRLGAGRGNGTVNRVFGTATRTVSVTVIVWEWLLMPILLLVIEVSVLVYMVIRSWIRRDEEVVWKSNILPLLYYSGIFSNVDGSEFDKEKAGSPERLMTTTEMERKTKQTHVRLRTDQTGRGPQKMLM